MLKAFRWLVRWRLNCFLERRLHGFNPGSKTLAQMHTGQNSMAPENSFPQLGQVHWGLVLTVVTALQGDVSRQQDHARTERCEIG